MKHAYVSLAVICLIFGVMVSAQYKSNQNSPTYFSNDRWAELAIQTEKLKNQHNALKNEIVSLQYQLNNADTAAQAESIKKMLNKANIAAGTIPVTGPGIVMVLGDTPDLSLQESANHMLQYWNILTIINELNAAGAEAISINDERIVAISGINHEGSTIIVNRNPIKSPFEIKAIGNAKILESSLNLKGGEIESLLFIGNKIEIQKNDQVDIPAYSGGISFHYAKPKQVIDF